MILQTFYLNSASKTAKVRRSTTVEMEMWTRFMDMHSGGSLKVRPFSRIFVEGSEDEAVAIFQRRFGRDPFRITCDCCGEDYSVSEYPSLDEATKYDIGGTISVEEYLKRADVLVIPIEKLGSAKLEKAL